MRDFIQEYGAILSGLVVGSLAHFGRLVAEGRMPTIVQAIGYIMQLGLVGLTSVVLTEKLGMVDSDLRALTTAILAVSTNEVVQFMKRRSWRPLLDTLMVILHNPVDPRK